ncbi:MAG: lipid A disaccharide synthetase, partial [Enterobacterales bacterium]
MQNTSKLKIAIVAGESSGDLLGSDLLQSFR